MRRHERGAPCVEPAIELRELELHLVGERDAVLHRQLVERAGDGPLHAGAVVAPDPDDQRVVELAQVLDRVDHPPDVVVGVLGVARVDLHLAGVERLQLVGHVVPGRERLVARGQLGVRGDDPELLLAGEGLLAQPVPPLVELALVPVRPLLARRGAGHGCSPSSSTRRRACRRPGPVPRGAIRSCGRPSRRGSSTDAPRRRTPRACR